MSRKVFFIIAGILPILFGLTMIFNGKQMLDMVAIETNASTAVVLQWMGCPLISVGIMNLLARNDEGSIALRALMIGNILIHVLGMGIDVYDYASGFIKMSGVVMGAIVHIGLGGGFAFYLSRLGRAR
jgi:hypothetical protein